MSGIPVAFTYLSGQSGSASWTGPRVQKGRERDLSLHITHTTDCSGTLALWSADGPNDTGAVVDGASVEFTQPSGANAGTYECNWTNMPGKYWWLVYTRASGSGTFTITGTQSDLW
jgi:hypothetical protein